MPQIIAIIVAKIPKPCQKDIPATLLITYNNFDRYTDKEIRDLLNHTVEVTPQREFHLLDETHAEAYADQPRLAQYPSQVRPSTHQEQEVYRQVAQGYRM